jgi:hypothetical protein
MTLFPMETLLSPQLRCDGRDHVRFPFTSARIRLIEGQMLRAIAIAFLGLTTCREPAKPIERAEAPPAPAALSSDEGRVIDLTAKAAPSGASRELQPLDGHDGCIEMYTTCVSPGTRQENCTSASLRLACDEIAKLPSTGEQLKCVCP